MKGNQKESGTLLLNTLFVLLFFNLSAMGIMEYCQSIKVDFQQLIQRQQVGQAIFAHFEQNAYKAPRYAVYNQQIMTQSLSQSVGCQQINGFSANAPMSLVSLYRWSCH